MNIIGTRHFKWKIVARWIGFIVIPGLFVVLGMYLKNSRGPYWSGSNYDPDYAYLMNALNVIEDLPIGHIDHPGTPVQIFIAIVMRCVHFLRNNFVYDWPTLETDVLTNPELYLQTVSYVFLIINALLLSTIGFTAYYKLKNVWLGWLLQTAPFFSSYIPMNSLVKVAPEAMLLTVVLLLMLWLVMMLKSKQQTWRHGIVYALIAAMIIGLGIATKMNFLPTIVLPLIIIRTIRLKLLYLISAVSFFFFFTLPIRQRYAELFDWVIKIFQHSGIHGAGTAQILDWSVYWSNLKILLDGFPHIFEVIILFLLVSIVSIIVLPQRRQYLQTMTFRVGAAAAITQILAFGFIAKHMIQYYYLPFVPLTAMMICCALLQLRHFHEPKTVATICLTILFFVFAGQSMALTFSEVKKLNTVEKNTKQEVLSLQQELQERYADYTVFHYFRSSSLEFALNFGNNSVSQSYNWELTQLYPNYFVYEIFTKQFSKWNTVIDIHSFLQQNPKVILTGSPFETSYVSEPHYRPDITLTDQFHGVNETFYLVSP